MPRVLYQPFQVAGDGSSLDEFCARFQLWSGIPVPYFFFSNPVSVVLSAILWALKSLLVISFSARFPFWLLTMTITHWCREQEVQSAIQTFRRTRCLDFGRIIRFKCLLFAWQIRVSGIMPAPPSWAVFYCLLLYLPIFLWPSWITTVFLRLFLQLKDFITPKSHLVNDCHSS